MKLFDPTRIVYALTIGVMVSLIALGTKQNDFFFIVIGNIGLAFGVLAITDHKHDKKL